MDIVITMIVSWTMLDLGITGEADLTFTGFGDLAECELALDELRTTVGDAPSILYFTGECIEEGGT